VFLELKKKEISFGSQDYFEIKINQFKSYNLNEMQSF